MSRSQKAFTRVQPPPSLEMVMSWEDEKFQKQLEKCPSSPVLSPNRKISTSPGKVRQLPPAAFVSPSKHDRSNQTGESREESFKKMLDFFSNLKEVEAKEKEEKKGKEKEEGKKNKGEGGKKKKNQKKEISEKRKVQSQIEGPSLSSPDFAFSISQAAKKTCEKFINQNLTVMCLEVWNLFRYYPLHPSATIFLFFFFSFLFFSFLFFSLPLFHH